MQNLSDKELDELMKKASESQEYSYDANTWTSLEQKLDNQPRNGFTYLKKSLILLFIVGTSVTVGLVWNSFDLSRVLPQGDYTQLAPPTESKNQLQETKPESQHLTRTSVQAAQSPGNPSPSPVISEERVSLQRSSEDKSAPSLQLQSVDATDKGTQEQAEAVESKYTINTSVQATRSLANTNTLSSISNEHAITEGNNEGRSASVTEQFVNLTQPSEKIKQDEFSTNGIRTRGQQKKITPVVQDSTELVLQETSVVTDYDSTIVTASEQKKKKAITSVPLAFKFSISPDFSAQNFSKVAQSGSNMGALLEYRFSTAVSISAGLLRTRKYYTAKDVEYGYYTAEFVEGNCQMWDIPLTLSYYFPTKRSIQFFTSIGASSYIMNEEDYVYYPDESNKALRYYATIEDKNKEWFKVLNVSIGIQKQLSETWFVQVEPFVKAPLTGLGEGNISLSSLGTFLSIKYQLKTKRLHATTTD